MLLIDLEWMSALEIHTMQAGRCLSDFNEKTTSTIQNTGLKISPPESFVSSKDLSLNLREIKVM